MCAFHGGGGGGGDANGGGVTVVFCPVGFGLLCVHHHSRNVLSPYEKTMQGIQSGKVMIRKKDPGSPHTLGGNRQSTRRKSGVILSIVAIVERRILTQTTLLKDIRGRVYNSGSLSLSLSNFWSTISVEPILFQTGAR